jgi:uncharacterized protein (DUF2062 family)
VSTSRRPLLGFTRIRAWFRQRLREHLTPKEVGLGVGIGFFIGALPIYGAHILVCIALARALKLNQAVVYGAANISNPFFAPFLVALEIHLGAWLRGVEGGILPEGAFWELLEAAPSVFWSCLIGSLVVGAVGGLVFGALSALGLGLWQRRA